MPLFGRVLADLREHIATREEKMAAVESILRELNATPPPGALSLCEEAGALRIAEGGDLSVVEAWSARR